eukprot:10709595-Lingulodinium_polyedra.AAC.1
MPAEAAWGAVAVCLAAGWWEEALALALAFAGLLRIGEVLKLRCRDVAVPALAGSRASGAV